MLLQGSFPGFLNGTKGTLRAYATGAAKTNPRHSGPTEHIQKTRAHTRARCVRMLNCCGTAAGRHRGQTCRARQLARTGRCFPGGEGVRGAQDSRCKVKLGDRPMPTTAVMSRFEYLAARASITPRKAVGLASSIDMSLNCRPCARESRVSTKIPTSQWLVQCGKTQPYQQRAPRKSCACRAERILPRRVAFDQADRARMGLKIPASGSWAQSEWTG